MLTLSWEAMAGLLAAGVLTGALAWRLVMQWQEQRRRRFPKRWLMEARGLLTTSEHEVWHWLKGAFYDHQVLIKTPLSRFTRPRNKADGQACSFRLGTMFCTFTVCTSDGTVIGCLDVPGKAGLLRSHRETKESILTSCGIAYAVVRASNPPTLEAMRAAFLGEIDVGFVDSEGAMAEDIAEEFKEELRAFAAGQSQPAPLAEARVSLQTRLEFARKGRVADFNPLITQTGTLEDGAPRGFADTMLWRDSFLAPPDTRPAAL